MKSEFQEISIGLSATRKSETERRIVDGINCAISTRGNVAPTEKKLARIAFDKAFERQCTAITQKARRMLETTTAPSEIFRVQEYLTEQRRIVDGLYDYRYSRLLAVFGRLLSEGWLREGDLNGLQPEKIAKIKHEASFFAEGNL